MSVPGVVSLSNIMLPMEITTEIVLYSHFIESQPRIRLRRRLQLRQVCKTWDHIVSSSTEISRDLIIYFPSMPSWRDLLDHAIELSRTRENYLVGLHICFDYDNKWEETNWPLSESDGRALRSLIHELVPYVTSFTLDSAPGQNIGGVGTLFLPHRELRHLEEDEATFPTSPLIWKNLHTINLGRVHTEWQLYDLSNDAKAEEGEGNSDGDSDDDVDTYWSRPGPPIRFPALQHVAIEAPCITDSPSDITCQWKLPVSQLTHLSLMWWENWGHTYHDILEQCERLEELKVGLAVWQRLQKLPVPSPPVKLPALRKLEVWDRSGIEFDAFLTPLVLPELESLSLQTAGWRITGVHLFLGDPYPSRDIPTLAYMTLSSLVTRSNANLQSLKIVFTDRRLRLGPQPRGARGRALSELRALCSPALRFEVLRVTPSRE